MFINIKFEIDPSGIDGLPSEVLHELLCKAVHESDQEALLSLSEMVIDIKIE